MEKIINVKQVQEVTGLSRTTIWRLQRTGNFPKNFHISPARKGWRLSDVENWIQEMAGETI